MTMADHERIDRILNSIEQAFPGIEVLKAGAHRERGVLSVKVVVDRAGGVDTALCEKISKYVTQRLDVLEPIAQYRVEVQSAGVERPLLSPEHFRRFAGRGARVITSLHIKNRVEFSGPIVASGEQSVTLADPHAGEVEIPYAAIKRAHLTYEPREDLRKK